MTGPQFPSQVEIVELADKQVVLVGTAHVSLSSAELAERIIREMTPQSVAVELCSGRYATLLDPDGWQRTSWRSLVRSGKASVVLAQLILGGFQKRIARQLGMRPGEEMLRAVKAAEEVGARVVLADRDIGVTLRRAWARLTWKGTFRILAALAKALISPQPVRQEEIEELKSPQGLEEALEEFSGALPELRAPLLDERDRYLAGRIHQACGPRVVAVLGAGHVAGVRRCLLQDPPGWRELAALEEVPSPRRRRAWPGPALLLALALGALWWLRR